MLRVFVVFSIGYFAYARCPNDCSRRGKCTLENTCECDTGFDVVADCSQGMLLGSHICSELSIIIFSEFLIRFELATCPTGVAWFDKASAINTAHALAECSNQGICDRETVYNVQ